MPFGYNGKILRVNLTSGALDVEERDEVFYRTYFGGTNFVAYYLLRETKPGVDPLGPDNRLIFAAGPVTGAPLGGSGRNNVGGKSPLTGGFGDSQGGGYFGAELKHAGFDAIVVEGQAAKPVYLLVVDGKAELKDAGHLWGKETAETEAAIRAETGEKLLRTATIGPAGEKMVRYACVLNDLSHAAGRTGMGAVMGSKKLKAVAVRGRGGPAMADQARVRELAKYLVDNWKTWAGALNDLGTANVVRGLNAGGGLPTRNFREGAFEHYEEICGETMRDTILVGRGTCYACPIHCKREVRVGEPWHVEPLYGGPEYETIAAVGSLCGVHDLGAIAKANWICNAQGVDTISVGTTIAFAMECFEAGLLSEKDTGGLRLTFGNAEAMVKMVEMIARREGLGDLLAEGVRRAAEQIGGRAPEYAMHIKGQELPMHEPRLKQGMGIGYAVSPTGADHCHSIHDTLFTGQSLDLQRIKTMGFLEPLPARDLGEQKVRLHFYDSTWRHTLNTLVACLLVKWPYDKMTEVVNAVTGWNSSYMELHKVGERAQTLARIFNLREGFTSADDTMPRRIFSPFPSGPLAGVGVDEDLHHKAVVTYYQMMGWDAQGIPTPAKLAELNISWAGSEIPLK